MIRGILIALTIAAPDSPCPSGAQLKERTTKEAREQWCETSEGVRQGSRRAWYANGQQWFAGSYDRGKRTGDWKFWYPGGKPMSSGSYRADKFHGRATRWHETGQKAVEGDCDNGLERGVWIRWWPNGKREMEATFRAGKLVGLARTWSRRGQPLEFSDWIGQRVRGAQPNSERFKRAMKQYRPEALFRECAD